MTHRYCRRLTGITDDVCALLEELARAAQLGVSLADLMEHRLVTVVDAATPFRLAVITLALVRLKRNDITSRPDHARPRAPKTQQHHVTLDLVRLKRNDITSHPDHACPRAPKTQKHHVTP